MTSDDTELVIQQLIGLLDKAITKMEELNARVCELEARAKSDDEAKYGPNVGRSFKN